MPHLPLQSLLVDALDALKAGGDWVGSPLSSGGSCLFPILFILVLLDIVIT